MTARYRRRHTALACLAVALVAAACTTEDAGSGSASGDDTDLPVAEGATDSWDVEELDVDMSDLECTEDAADPDRGVTDTAVTVGSLTTESGPTTALWGDAVVGAQVRIDRANAEGGVHGRTIEHAVQVDDGLESTRAVDGARRLATRDEVFAVVPAISAMEAFADPLCEEVVPYFGWGFTSAYCNRAVAFGFNGCLTPDLDEYPSSAGPTFSALLGGDEGDGTIALVGNESASARQGMENLAGVLDDAGLEVVAELAVLPETQALTDPSPYVQEIMTAADGEAPAGVWYIADFANTSTMTQAMGAAGYEGIQFNAVGYDPRLADFDAFHGTITTLQWLPFEATDNAFIEQMTADIEEHAPDTTLGIQVAAGYISADFFIAGLEETGPDLTVDSFLETLNGGDFSYDPEGLFGGSYWPENHMIATPCGVMVRNDDGNFDMVVPLSCA